MKSVCSRGMLCPWYLQERRVIWQGTNRFWETTSKDFSTTSKSPFFFFSLKDLGKLKKNFKKLFLQEQSPVRKLITGLGLDKEWQDGDSMDKSGQVIVFSQRLVSPKQQDGREAQVLSQHSSIRLPQLQFSRRQYCA